MNTPLPTRRVWPWALGAALVAFAVFAPTVRFGFVNWDDPDLIFETPRVVTASPVELFTQSGTAYLPVRDLVWNLTHRVAGPRPAAYHLLNVALHAAATALFCLLVARLLGGAPAVVAGVAALAFAVHPLHVEPVAWASGMKDPLSAVLLFGSFVAALGAEREQGRGRRLAVTVFALVLFWLAALAKSSALVLPLLIALYAVALAPDRKRTLKLLVPFVVTAVVLAIVAFVAGRASGAVKVRTDAAGTVALTSAGVFADALRHLVLPVGLSPRYPAVRLASLADARAVTGLLAVVSYVVVWAWAMVRRHRRLAFAMGWVAVALAPYLGLVPTSTLWADRYAYVAVGGLAIALGLAAGAALNTGYWTLATGCSEPTESGAAACGSAGIGRWARRLCVVALALVVVGYGVVSVRQSGVWQSSERLWRRALAVAPNDALAHYLLGDAVWERQPLAAAPHFERAADIHREAAGEQWIAAAAARARIDGVLSERHVAKALQHERLAADALAYLGTTWLHAEVGSRGRAYAVHREALALSRGDARFHYLVASDLAEQGRRAEALVHYESAGHGPAWLHRQSVADIKALRREFLAAGKPKLAEAAAKAVARLAKRGRSRP